MAGMKKSITQIIDEYDTMNTKDSSGYDHITRALGVSFSGQNIYFAEVEKTEQQYRVCNYGTIGTNLKFGTGIEGVEKNIRDIYMFINGFIDSHNIEAHYLNLCLNTHLIILHQTLIQGHLTGSEIDHFLRWEFNQHLLDDIDQYTVNTHTMEENSSTGDRLVLMAGVRRKITDNFTAVLEKAKIKLQNIDIDIFCSHTTYEINYTPIPNQITLLVDLKPGVAGILVCLGHAVKSFYQSSSSVKASEERLADILNHHIDNLIYLFNTEHQTQYQVGRTILCNALAKSILPLVDSRFHPECINPFNQLNRPELFVNPNPSETEPKNSELTEQSEEDYTMYAESIGAAIKLLA